MGNTRLKLRVQLKVLVNLLHGRLALGIMSGVVGLERLSLRRRANRERGIYKPGTFVVPDVGANFANSLRVAVAVQHIVLYLQVGQGSSPRQCT